MFCTKARKMVASSHQNDAADILLASKRARTAMVANTKAAQLPTHTFQAMSTFGGVGVAIMTA